MEATGIELKMTRMIKILWVFTEKTPLLCAYYIALFSLFQELSDSEERSSLPKSSSGGQVIDKMPVKGLASSRKDAANTVSEREESSPSGKSPRKKMKLSEKPCANKLHTSPLVVILEDVESFPSSVLNDLILICR